MYQHRPMPLLACAAAIVIVLAGCGPVEDDAADQVSDLLSTPTATPAATPDPSPTPAGEDDGGEDQEEGGEDQPGGGDCAAYADSDGWCTNGIGDYDCEGGTGNGPNYAPRGIRVINPGTDPFGLDRDNDGEGCEAPAAEPPPPDPGPDTDPRFDTCGEAIAAGYGPYYQGQDPEYDWYRDADSDGVVCER